MNRGRRLEGRDALSSGADVLFPFYAAEHG